MSEPTGREREVALLRNALRASSGEPELDASIYESIALAVHGDADLERIYREETAPEQAQLDISIDGTTVSGHATNAARFASFVRRISQTTKFAARSIAGIERHSEELLIEGVLPGSVRAILRAPAHTREGGQAPHPDIPADTADSLALKQVARILTNASTVADEPDSESLYGLVQALPTPARRALRGAAKEVLEGGWEVSGALRQRRRPEEAVRVTPAGASRLRLALHFSPGEPTREVRVGYFDGLRVSAGVVYFMPTAGQRRGFAAAAPDEELLKHVAHLVADRDERDQLREVRATFLLYEQEAEAGVPSRRSRVLNGIEELRTLESGAPLPLQSL